VARLGCCLAALCSLSAGTDGSAPHWLRIATEDRVVWQAAIATGERIDFSFVHSQERTLWTQHYRVGDGGVLWQEGSTFGSYGAGMPTGPTRRSRAGLTEATIRRLGAVHLLNSKRAHLMLHYRGRTIAVDQWFEDYEPFAIRVE
jgi:hypothetical protein